MPLHPRYIDHPTCTHCNGVGQVARVDGLMIRRKRATSGFSLRTMADKLGISAAYLSDMELGRRRMSEALAEEIVAICERKTEGSR